MKRKAKINTLINICMLISFIITSITAISVFFQVYFLHMIGVKQGSFTNIANVCHLETMLHLIFGFIFIVLVGIHMLLHWWWFKNLPKNLKK